MIITQYPLKGCRNGNSCFFSHTSDQRTLPSNTEGSHLAEDPDADASQLLSLFPDPDHACILVLDDLDFQYSANFARFYDPSSIVCTTSQANGSLGDPFLKDMRIFRGLSHPYETIISKSGKSTIPWNDVKCVMWIPKFDNDVENWEEQKGLIKTFFEYLAIRILGDALLGVQAIIVMNNIRFAHLQVERLGRESLFYLRESFGFDEYSFGKLFDGVNTKKPMLVSKPIVYAFNLQPPSDVQFGHYTSVLHKQLHNMS